MQHLHTLVSAARRQHQNHRNGAKDVVGTVCGHHYGTCQFPSLPSHPCVAARLHLCCRRMTLLLPAGTRSTPCPAWRLTTSRSSGRRSRSCLSGQKCSTQVRVNIWLHVCCPATPWGQHRGNHWLSKQFLCLLVHLHCTGLQLLQHVACVFQG